MSQLTAPSLDELKSWAYGKVVIVTGAARGVGLAIAQQFADCGAKVVISDIDEAVGEEAAKTIGPNATFITCDVSSWEDQVSLFRETIARHGRVDLVVANAGYNPELMASNGPKYDYLAEEYTDANKENLRQPFTKIFDVNLNGTVYNLKLALHHMKQTGGGWVVVIGSLGSYIPVPDQALYCASKHAVLGLVRATSAREEFISNDISISLVAPSLTETRMTEEVMKNLPPGLLISSPKDVAAAVAILVTLAPEKARGKAIWVQGDTYTEVEDATSDLHTRLRL